MQRQTAVTDQMEPLRDPSKFERQSLSFEAVENKAFTDVLYSDSIYGLIDLHLKECVKREARLPVCKNPDTMMQLRSQSIQR